MAETWDVAVVGGGTAGIPCAIFAAQRGLRVLVLEHAPQVGGTLHYSAGQMSAAGTRRQHEMGIVDSPARHFADIMRLSGNTADPVLVRLAVDHAAATLDWIEELGYRPLGGHPITGLAHEPYDARRSLVSAEGGLDIRRSIVAPFDDLVAAGRIALHLDTEAEELCQDADGAIRGVIARDRSGTRHRYAARNVVLATGGFASNPLLFEELMGRPQFSAFAYPYAQGTGTKLARAAGGWVRGADNYLCQFGPILETEERSARLLAWADVGVTDRLPWEIYVNSRGARFVAEDTPSIHTRETALLAQPDCRFWIVFDESIARKSPPLVVGWSAAKTMAAFATQPTFHRAGSADALAAKAGIERSGLTASISDYNSAVAAGHDALGRRFLPEPIAHPPFYAIRCQGTSAGSCAGIAVGKELRVIDAENEPIPNLFAAGEILGSGQLMGQAFCGGMMVTPALTFGRILGQEILQ